MRLSQFTENKALADTEKVIAKNFSPERSAVKDKIVSLVRDVMMGKGDRMQQAMEITALTKSELEAKSMDPDLEVGVNQNLGMLKRAMEKVVGAKIVDDITEQEEQHEHHPSGFYPSSIAQYNSYKDMLYGCLMGESLRPLSIYQSTR